MVEMGVIRSLRALPMPPKSTPTPKFAALFGAQLKAQEAAPASGVVGGQGHAKSTTFCYKSTRTPKIFAPAAGCGRLRREVRLASAGARRPSWRPRLDCVSLVRRVSTEQCIRCKKPAPFLLQSTHTHPKVAPAADRGHTLWLGLPSAGRVKIGLGPRPRSASK